MLIYMLLKQQNFELIQFHSLPEEENLGWSKLKAIADDIINVIEIIISLSYRVENTFGKGEMLVTFFLRVVKSWDCVVKS